MITRRLAILAPLAVCLLAGPARAEIGEKFTWTAFEAAQKAGKPILLMVHAAWCPTCQQQKAVVEELFFSDRFKDLTFFVVNFDQQKDVVRKFKASMQSMLVVFKGSTEVGRSAGDTSRASIEALMAKAL